MKSIAKLKDEARRLEQREEWEKAMTVYLQVLEEAAENEAEVELPLYNRVGDLSVRLGRPQEAVRYYEQAADRYAEAGLYNNAIALCNKALRYNADHLELLKKLGQFSASQGFLTDARRYFLEYAEKKAASGKVNDALNALEDFANLSDDPEIREMLGRKLHQHNRSEEAVAELKRALALRLKAGHTEAADAVRNEIRAIDPNALMEQEAPPRPTPVAEPSFEAAEDDLPGLLDIDPGAAFAGSEDTDAADTGLLAGFETGRADDGADGFALDLPELEEAPAFGDVAGTGTVEGFESTTLEIQDIEPLPGLDVEHDETSFDDDASTSFDLPTLDDESSSASLALPTLDDDPTVESFTFPSLDDEAEPAPLPSLDDAFELPTLDDDEEAAPFDLPTLDDVAEAADDGELVDTGSFSLPSLDDTADAVLDTEEPALDLPGLDDAAFDLPPTEDDAEEHTGFDESLDIAAESADSAVEAEPDAAPIIDTGGGWSPDMSLPPAPKPAAPATPQKPAGKAGGDGFVDLGDFLTDDSPEDTRFRIQETAPTGDEDRDFADMLSQFRAKVSEHLPPEDAAAHYDLGLAFKEMGLVDEAISEFQIALRSGHMKLKVYEELGQCFLAKQQYNIAEKVLRRAMEMKYDDEIELIGVYYHLGRAYEGMGHRDHARDAYERVLGMDINFQDVMDRLAKL